MRTDPKYSIIITAFNRREYIQAAFDSAVSQDYTGSYEIIIVSNFVDKNIYARAQNNPSFVKYIFDEAESLGPKQAAGILEARGEWICLLDDDDIFFRNKLSELDNIIRDTQNAGIIKNPVHLINANGDEIQYQNQKNLLYSLMDPIGYFPEAKKKDYNLFHKILSVQNDYFKFYAIFSNNSSLTIKREILLNHLEYVKSLKLMSEPLFLSLVLVERKDLIVTNKLLGMYRIHSNNFSNINDVDPMVSLNKLKKIVDDMELSSSIPLESRYRNVLQTTLSRFKILYIYRMYLHKQLTFKQLIKPSLIITLLRSVFGRPQSRIFMLQFRFFRNIYLCITQ